MNCCLSWLGGRFSAITRGTVPGEEPKSKDSMMSRFSEAAELRNECLQGHGRILAGGEKDNLRLGGSLGVMTRTATAPSFTLTTEKNFEKTGKEAERCDSRRIPSKI